MQNFLIRLKQRKSLSGTQESVVHGNAAALYQEGPHKLQGSFPRGESNFIVKKIYLKYSISLLIGF